MRWKRLVFVTVAIAGTGAAALFLWARSVLGSEQVRTAVEAQLSRALGQPVTIGSVGAGIFPRVTLTLHNVRIGGSGRVTARELHVGADFRALLSRRIERGVLTLDGARIELPLPPFAFAEGSTTASASGKAPVQIGSIEAIRLNDVEIVSGGRTLRGDVDVVPVGAGLDVRRVALEAEGTSLEMTGTITDMAGPTGELAVKANGLNVLDLLAFVEDFSAGVAVGKASAAAPAAPMNLRIDIDAGRAVVGALLLEAVTGRARITNDAATFDPVSFGVFGGKYSGAFALTLAEIPAFRVTADLQGLDVAQVMSFAGSDGAMTGRLHGTLDVRGAGVEIDRALASLDGTARLDVRDGTVAGLGLVRTVVLAGSMRADSQNAIGKKPASGPEPFSSITARFTIVNGAATTTDLKFQSPDVLLTASGTISLASQRAELAGEVQLSDALTKQAGRDLVRYTREDGRVTLPMTVAGTPGDFAVRIDAAAAAKRAIANRAEEEAKKALGGLFKRIIKRSH